MQLNSKKASLLFASVFAGVGMIFGYVVGHFAVPPKTDQAIENTLDEDLVRARYCPEASGKGDTVNVGCNGFF